MDIVSEKNEQPCTIAGVSYCTLASLNIGDKVQIEHAHKFENGYWQCWSKTDYKYLGFERGRFHFENVDYKHEHFRMKEELEEMHRFKGKYSC